MDQHETPPSEAVTFNLAEIAAIDEAIQSLETEGSIPYEEVAAWLKSLGTDSPLPEQQPRKD